LGQTKSKELVKKSESFWQMLELSESRKSTQVGGAVLEGIAKDFIREFLPMGLGIKSGLVFDTETKKMSPQIDGIIYSGVPLLEFSDVVVEKEQVKAIVEVKSWIDTPFIFGERSGSYRDATSGLAYTFKRRRDFLPPGAKSILFTFELHSAYPDTEVLRRLKKICDSYAVVIRREPKIERERGKEGCAYNFDNSVSRLIEWLRNLS
jgi:hypothetical protein